MSFKRKQPTSEEYHQHTLGSRLCAKKYSAMDVYCSKNYYFSLLRVLEPKTWELAEFQNCHAMAVVEWKSCEHILFTAVSFVEHVLPKFACLSMDILLEASQESEFLTYQTEYPTKTTMS